MGKSAKFFTNAYGQARGVDPPPYGPPDRKISVIFFDDFPKGTLEKLIELESESKILMQKLKNLY